MGEAKRRKLGKCQPSPAGPCTLPSLVPTTYLEPVPQTPEEKLEAAVRRRHPGARVAFVFGLAGALSSEPWERPFVRAGKGGGR